MTEPSTELLPLLTAAIARGDFTVPAYPAAALKLRRLIAADNYSIPQLSEAIASDPALAATVLRLANSPLYRPDGPAITTVGRAIHRIGARSLAAVAAASGVGAAACARGPLLDLKYAVWRRAVTCALISQKLGPARGLDAEEAFLAGLLYGFGRTVAVACLEKILGTNAPPRPLTPAEWLALVDEHRATLARAVAERWELPKELAVAIGASPSQTSDMAHLLALAEELSRAMDQNLPLVSERLSEREQGLLSELCTVLAGALAALVEAPEGNRPPPPSAIKKPATALKGEVRAAPFDVIDARARPGSMLKATAISADGLRMTSDRPFQEACLVHLAIPREPTPLRVWASVVLCAPDALGFLVEVQLFTPSKELKSEWLALFESAR